MPEILDLGKLDYLKNEVCFEDMQSLMESKQNRNSRGIGLYIPISQSICPVCLNFSTHKFEKAKMPLLTFLTSILNCHYCVQMQA